MEQAEKRRFTLYLAVAFGVAWAMQLAVWVLRTGPIAQLLMVGVMFVPTLAVLIAKRGLGEGSAGICWRPGIRKNWPFYLLAWLLPGVMTAAGAALYFLVFPDRFALTWAYLASAYEAAGIEVADGAVMGVPLGAVAASQILSAVTFAPFINLIPALGEEIGWRGYMTPRFRELLGDRAGLLVSGAVWGLWHAPLIVLVGYEYGVGYFGAPVTGVLLFCVFGAVCGALLSLLYERTRSIWAPALAHGAMNAVGAVPFLFCAETPTQYLLGPVPCGLIPMLPTLALTAVLLLRRKSKSTL